jgi:hypothetical protein
VRRALWFAALLALFVPDPVHAQEEVVGTLAGTVTLGDARPDSGWVTLHMIRTEPETAGPVDSVRVGADGAFQFELPTLPDPGGGGEVYFASMRWDGILYFGPPIKTVVELESEYEISVYWTRMVSEGEVVVEILHRTMVMDWTPAGWQVLEHLILRNPLDSTLITGPAGAPTFLHPLAAGAIGLEVGEGSLSPDAVAIVEGSLWVAAPIPPGDMEYLYQYATPDSAFDFPGAALTDSLELFVGEPAPQLAVAGLTDGGSIPDGVRSYRSWVGGRETQPFRMEPGAQVGPDSLPVRGIVAGLAVLLALAGILAMTSRPNAPRAS